MAALIRDAGSTDLPFLIEMLGCAAEWRPGSVQPDPDELLDRPDMGHYIAGWPRLDDYGVLAEAEDRPVGAAWWRHFTPDDPGYGFVAAEVPEVAMGVVEEWRGNGIGRRLLRGLIERASETGLRGLSLSVEPENPASNLYRSLGFREVGRVGESLTMLLKLSVT